MSLGFRAGHDRMAAAKRMAVLLALCLVAADHLIDRQLINNLVEPIKRTAARAIR